MPSRTGGNYPAPIAVFDCLEKGLEASIEGGIAIEVDAFATLIQRPEPRNMIRALFVGAQDYGKRRKSNTLLSGIVDMGEVISAALPAPGHGRLFAVVAKGLIAAVRPRLGFTIPEIRTGDGWAR